MVYQWYSFLCLYNLSFLPSLKTSWNEARFGLKISGKVSSISNPFFLDLKSFVKWVEVLCSLTREMVRMNKIEISNISYLHHQESHQRKLVLGISHHKYTLNYILCLLMLRPKEKNKNRLYCTTFSVFDSTKF